MAAEMRGLPAAATFCDYHVGCWIHIGLRFRFLAFKRISFNNIVFSDVFVSKVLARVQEPYILTNSLSAELHFLDVYDLVHLILS